MNALMSIGGITFSIVFLTQNISQHPNPTVTAWGQESGATSSPVTNESVEKGLRKNRETLRALPEFQTNDVHTHLRLGEILSQQGDPNGAIEEYKTVITLDPAFAEAYRELGAVYIDKHDWRKAEQALRRSVELNHQDHQALYWLGRSLIAQDDFEQARQALKNAVQLDPTQTEAYSDLALAFMAEGYSQKAQMALEEAISRQPDFAEAHDRLERVHTAGDDPERLIQSARQILETLFRRE